VPTPASLLTSVRWTNKTGADDSSDLRDTSRVALMRRKSVEMGLLLR
jgi:hypothetical protein